MPEEMRSFSSRGFWMPASALEWVYLGLIIEAYALTLPVMVASWLQAAPDEDEE